MRKTLIAIIAVLSTLQLVGCGRSPSESVDTQEPRVIHIGTTSSVENSGLLAEILPKFQDQTGIEVRAIAVGSGRALNLARRGDVDAVITHDPVAERAFVDGGHSAYYRKVMYNDFVVAGPAADPASLLGSRNVADAMRRIATNGGPFASRGDRSGTHTREKSLWHVSEVAPGGSWYLETGQGMAGTLRVADERRAYILTDRATFGQLAESLRLRILFEGGSELLNTYAVIVARGTDDTRAADALTFARWLSDGAGREEVDRYRIGNAKAFVVWPSGAKGDEPDDLPGDP